MGDHEQEPPDTGQNDQDTQSPPDGSEEPKPEESPHEDEPQSEGGDSQKPKRKQQTPKQIGEFLLGDTLGQGVTGVVKLATYMPTGKQVALKIIKKKYLDSKPKLWKKVKREIAILKLMEHPHILKLYDVLVTNKKIYLVTEYVTGGELFDYILEKGQLPREEALTLLSQIVMGLEHCHDNLICHRDLKPENLLLDEKHNIKIADFGMAQLMKKGTMLKTSCGSPHYASPEVIKGEPYDGKISDVWSCGVIFFALVTGSLPFDHESIPFLLELVEKGDYKIPPNVDEDIADLIRSMLTVSPSQRIQMCDIKEHKVFKGTSYFFQKSAAMSLPALLATIPPSALLSPHSPSSPDGPETPSTRGRSSSDGAMNVPSSDSVDGLNEVTLADLESLGWGTVKYLRSKILNSEPVNTEKILYQHLQRRKESRLRELTDPMKSPSSYHAYLPTSFAFPPSSSASSSLDSSSSSSFSSRAPPTPTAPIKEEKFEKDNKEGVDVFIEVPEGEQEHSQISEIREDPDAEHDPLSEGREMEGDEKEDSLSSQSGEPSSSNNRNLSYPVPITQGEPSPSSLSLQEEKEENLPTPEPSPQSERPALAPLQPHTTLPPHAQPIRTPTPSSRQLALQQQQQQSRPGSLPGSRPSSRPSSPSSTTPSTLPITVSPVRTDRKMPGPHSDGVVLLSTTIPQLTTAAVFDVLTPGVGTRTPAVTPTHPPFSPEPFLMPTTQSRPNSNPNSPQFRPVRPNLELDTVGPDLDGEDPALSLDLDDSQRSNVSAPSSASTTARYRRRIPAEIVFDVEEEDESVQYDTGSTTSTSTEDSAPSRNVPLTRHASLPTPKNHHPMLTGTLSGGMRGVSPPSTGVGYSPSPSPGPGLNRYESPVPISSSTSFTSNPDRNVYTKPLPPLSLPPTNRDEVTVPNYPPDRFSGSLSAIYSPTIVDPLSIASPSPRNLSRPPSQPSSRPSSRPPSRGSMTRPGTVGTVGTVGTIGGVSPGVGLGSVPPPVLAQPDVLRVLASPPVPARTMPGLGTPSSNPSFPTGVIPPPGSNYRAPSPTAASYRLPPPSSIPKADPYPTPSPRQPPNPSPRTNFSFFDPTAVNPLVSPFPLPPGNLKSPIPPPTAPRGGMFFRGPPSASPATTSRAIQPQPPLSSHSHHPPLPSHTPPSPPLFNVPPSRGSGGFTMTPTSPSTPGLGPRAPSRSNTPSSATAIPPPGYQSYSPSYSSVEPPMISPLGTTRPLTGGSGGARPPPNQRVTPTVTAISPSKNLTAPVLTPASPSPRNIRRKSFFNQVRKFAFGKDNRGTPSPPPTNPPFLSPLSSSTTLASTTPLPSHLVQPSTAPAPFSPSSLDFQPKNTRSQTTPEAPGPLKTFEKKTALGPIQRTRSWISSLFQKRRGSMDQKTIKDQASSVESAPTSPPVIDTSSNPSSHNSSPAQSASEPSNPTQLGGSFLSRKSSQELVSQLSEILHHLAVSYQQTGPNTLECIMSAPESAVDDVLSQSDRGPDQGRVHRGPVGGRRNSGGSLRGRTASLTKLASLEEEDPRTDIEPEMQSPVLSDHAVKFIVQIQEKSLAGEPRLSNQSTRSESDLSSKPPSPIFKFKDPRALPRPYVASPSSASSASMSSVDHGLSPRTDLESQPRNSDPAITGISAITDIDEDEDAVDRSEDKEDEGEERSESLDSSSLPVGTSSCSQPKTPSGSSQAPIPRSSRPHPSPALYPVAEEGENLETVGATPPKKGGPTVTPQNRDELEESLSRQTEIDDSRSRRGREILNNPRTREIFSEFRASSRRKSRDGLPEVVTGPFPEPEDASPQNQDEETDGGLSSRDPSDIAPDDMDSLRGRGLSLSEERERELRERSKDPRSSTGSTSSTGSVGSRLSRTSIDSGHVRTEPIRTVNFYFHGGNYHAFSKLHEEITRLIRA